MIGHRHLVPILKANQTYDFNSYFKMRSPLAEILRELDAEFQVKELVMPIADLKFSESTIGNSASLPRMSCSIEYRQIWKH
jgi:hypothetical protein